MEDFKKFLYRYGLYDPFNLYKVKEGSAGSPPRLFSTRICKFNNCLNITEYDVREINRFLSLYGQEYYLQNMEWSADLFESSCDEELRNKVTELTFSVPPEERGGPLLFFYHLHTILSMTEDSIREMTNRVRQTKISGIQGENVSKEVSQLRSEIIRLKTIKKLPPDITDKLLQVLQTTSIKEFNEVFKTMQMNERLNDNLR